MTKKGTQDVLLLQADETEGNSGALTPCSRRARQKHQHQPRECPAGEHAQAASEELRVCLINLRVSSTEPIWKSASLLHMKTVCGLFQIMTCTLRVCPSSPP